MGQRNSKITAVQPNFNEQLDGLPKGQSELDGASRSGQKEGEEGGKTVGGLLKSFAEQTTMHGPARVVTSDVQMVWRVLWLVLVLSAGGWAAYNVYSTLKLFSTYPVSTVVNVQYERQVNFPSVTLCNLNNLRKSQYEQNANFVGLRSDLSNVNTSADDFVDFQDEQKQLKQIKKFLRRLPSAELEYASHQLSDMLLMCDIAEEPCNYEHFTRFFNQKFGNCYTFNKKHNYTVTTAGPSQGLKLLLTVEEDEYMPQTQSVGVKVVVHPYDVMPFPENDGILLSPGSLTHVGVTKKVYRRTGAPYGDCMEPSLTDNLAVNMYTTAHAVNYSAQACINTCYQAMVVSDCQCCDPDFPCALDKVKGDRFKASYNHTFTPGLQYCDFNSTEIEQCVSWVTALQVTDNGIVDPLEKCVRVCKPQCYEEVFSHQVSVAAWPTQPATSGLVKLLESHFNLLGKNKTVDAEFLHRNIIRVEVFISQLNVESVVTDPAYDWLQLLSDLGGQASLWLGFSLMTAVELLQLLYDLLVLLMAKVYTMACTK